MAALGQALGGTPTHLTSPSAAAACSFNGRWPSSSGACVCAPQWQGPHCATLRLAPADKNGGFHSPHAVSSPPLVPPSGDNSTTPTAMGGREDTPSAASMLTKQSTAHNEGPAEPATAMFTDDANTSSWGGSILQDETTGLWHMFAAEMQGGCGIGSWQTNSQVGSTLLIKFLVKVDLLHVLKRPSESRCPRRRCTRPWHG
jgi:hypothetical protein